MDEHNKTKISTADISGLKITEGELPGFNDRRDDISARTGFSSRSAPVDKLSDIFTLQEELNDGIFKKQVITSPDGSQLTMKRIIQAVDSGRFGPNDLPNTWLRNYLLALQGESEELEVDLLWKWWSKDKIDIQNIRVEIVDMMHFVTSLALAAGLTADEFHRLYTAKHRVNHNRQEAGYSAATKDENDNKGIV